MTATSPERLLEEYAALLVVSGCNPVLVPMWADFIRRQAALSSLAEEGEGE